MYSVIHYTVHCYHSLQYTSDPGPHCNILVVGSPAAGGWWYYQEDEEDTWLNSPVPLNPSSSTCCSTRACSIEQSSYTWPCVWYTRTRQKYITMYRDLCSYMMDFDRVVWLITINYQASNLSNYLVLNAVLIHYHRANFKNFRSSRH